MSRAREELDRLLVSVPDFPEPGILFRDLAPVFADGIAFRALVDDLAAHFEGGFDAVAGVEARGFVLAAAVAYAAGVGVLVVRKAGKLPGVVLSETYDLEYGTATLELEPDRLPQGSRVLVLDDVLATGGTLAASARLIAGAGYSVAGFGVVLELADLAGRERLGDTPVYSIAAL
ncbi:adenine phosphoribosyltransferase [Planctomonas sp. JC2975]|uniref:adenine phosphoribosyltransferase n=1 Tax=Planctomonas sp. JC2975 TaxID=2729626 RepID=UPI001474A2DD|nr:adenine phosphoribosyltransferase [Planctomonas sp. JC2975]